MELDQTRLDVIEYCIKNTPVGELKEVLSDLQSLLGSEAIHLEPVSQILLDYHAAHGTTIEREGLVLQLTTLGRVSQSQFFDPKASATFEVDPYDLITVINFTPTKPNPNKLRKILQDEMDQYVFMHFLPTAQARVYENNNDLHVFLSCSCVNLKNMWTGEWIGEWTASKGKVLGKVTVKAHYFEEGNLQLSESKEFERELMSESDEELAKEILAAIKESDNAVQAGMYEIYDNLPQKVFKPMRRTMPVTHTKFAEIYKTKMLS